MLGKIIRTDKENILAITPKLSSEKERYLIGRAGYGAESETQDEYVIVARVDQDPIIMSYSANNWWSIGENWLYEIHESLCENWNYGELIRKVSIKLFEIRDAGTFITAAAVRRKSYIILFNLHTLEAKFDFDDWPLPVRTYRIAHEYIIEHWDELSSAEVIDVEYILGESSTKKESERLTW